MVFVIAGNVESDRNIVGRLLADNLGWEFVDGENLHPHDFGARNRNAVPNADPSFRMETLSAAINGWIYRWQDVVVSCPMLTETDRRRLSEISSLVKIVYSEPSHTTGAPPLLDRDCLEHMVGCVSLTEGVQNMNRNSKGSLLNFPGKWKRSSEKW